MHWNLPDGTEKNHHRTVGVPASNLITLRHKNRASSGRQIIFVKENVPVLTDNRTITDDYWSH
jgi:hypothetical protein